MRDGCELMIDLPMSVKAERFLRAMAAAAPKDTVVSNRYRGQRRVLMMYGAGAPRRLPLIAEHRSRGGRVVMWDMGYWDRKDSMRLAVDTLHPTPAQIDMAPAGKHRRGFDLRADASPGGPIMLVGLGPKSVFAYGLRPMQWERARLAALRDRYPGREIVWRPKGRDRAVLDGLRMIADEVPIAEAMRGCSLVVCRHSNVAVDACVAGVPVQCDDGAALALYRDQADPAPAERAEFLRKLAWWEWSRAEAPAAWKWIREVASQ
jgi:hypothetical protein